MAGWSPTLKALIDLVLNSKQPMFLIWGPERIWIYNDAFIPIAGSKHPRALGLAAYKVWSEAWLHLEPLVDKFKERMPLGRVAEPADIAAVVAFLASDDARFVNGVNLPVDGGVTASNGQPPQG